MRYKSIDWKERKAKWNKKEEEKVEEEKEVEYKKGRKDSKIAKEGREGTGIKKYVKGRKQSSKEEK